MGAPKHSAEIIEKARKLWRTPMQGKEIAAELGIGYKAFQGICQRNEFPKRRAMPVMVSGDVAGYTYETVTKFVGQPGVRGFVRIPEERATPPCRQPAAMKPEPVVVEKIQPTVVECLPTTSTDMLRYPNPGECAQPLRKSGHRWLYCLQATGSPRRDFCSGHDLRKAQTP